MLIAMPFIGVAQNYNPFVAQGVVSPAPLDNVASNGTGIVSFLVGNTGDDPVTLVTNQEMLLIITLSRGIPNNADPIAAIGGTMASYFDWMYDPGTASYLGTQNKTIPDALNGGVGTVEITYKVTSNSVETDPQNGFNVNLTPPAYTNGVNSLNDDQVSSYTWTVPASNTLPDINATFKDSTVTGSVHTNDSVPAGTTYGTPSALPTNPGPSTIVMQPDGKYTFVAPLVGVYQFLVPVCPAGQTTGCPKELLTITVTDPSINTNPPTANIDEATTIGTNPVTLNTLANDACNNLNCSLAPGSVSVVNPPRYGTATVDPSTGKITYQANQGFYGIDTLTYTVCDSTLSPVKCATALQIINVLPTGTSNLIALNDDYKVVPKNSTATGNVISNDQDPESNTITATPQTTLVPGKGTLVLDANGNYTFTPINNFVGNVEVPYNACDNGTPQACSKATLYITINAQSNPLPVQLISFYALPNSCQTNLSWSTSSEENSSHFNVLRKDSKHTDFVLVGKVMASGNTHSVHNYSFNDPGPQEGVNVYKLEIVDIDSKLTYSENRSVAIQCAGNSITLYPNPAGSFTNLIISNETNDTYEIKLMDISGKTIYTTTEEINQQRKAIRIPTENLAAGSYNIVVVNSGEVNVLRFEKVNE